MFDWISNLDYPNYDILIVENSKTPDNAELIKSYNIPNLTVIYVGGEFTTIGSATRNNIAKLNTTIISKTKIFLCFVLLPNHSETALPAIAKAGRD